MTTLQKVIMYALIKVKSFNLYQIFEYTQTYVHDSKRHAPLFSHMSTRNFLAFLGDNIKNNFETCLHILFILTPFLQSSQSCLITLPFKSIKFPQIYRKGQLHVKENCSFYSHCAVSLNPLSTTSPFPPSTW